MVVNSSTFLRAALKKLSTVRSRSTACSLTAIRRKRISENIVSAARVHFRLLFFLSSSACRQRSPFKNWTFMCFFALVCFQRLISRIELEKFRAFWEKFYLNLGSYLNSKSRRFKASLRSHSQTDLLHGSESTENLWLDNLWL